MTGRSAGRLAGLLGVFLAVPVTGMILGWGKEREESDPPSQADSTQQAANL